MELSERLQIIIPIAWAVLAVVGRWLLFRKAGKPGWLSIIPILSDYDEFAICWRGGKYFLSLILSFIGIGCGKMVEDKTILTGLIGNNAAQVEQVSTILLIVGGLALLWVLIIHLRQSVKLARSFDRGLLVGLLLFLFDRIGRVILGLGPAKYVGKS